MVGKMALLKPQTSNLRTFKTKTTPRMSIKHLACRRTSHEKRGIACRTPLRTRGSPARGCCSPPCCPCAREWSTARPPSHHTARWHPW